MKNLIIVFLLFLSVATFGQTTYTFATYDPLEITAPDNTNTHIIQCRTNGESDLHIQFPAANVGTVKINVSSSTMTGTGIGTFSNTTHPNGIVLRVRAKTGYKAYLLFSNTSDKVLVTRWN